MSLQGEENSDFKAVQPAGMLVADGPRQQRSYMNRSVSWLPLSALRIVEWAQWSARNGIGQRIYTEYVYSYPLFQCVVFFLWTRGSRKTQQATGDEFCEEIETPKMRISSLDWMLFLWSYRVAGKKVIDREQETRALCFHVELRNSWGHLLVVNIWYLPPLR